MRIRRSERIGRRGLPVGRQESGYSRFMDQQNGSGADAAAESAITAATEGASLDGYGQAAPHDPLTERPELLVGAAFLGGFLFAGLVSRLGR